MIFVGNTARSVRESQGLNQKDAAAVLGISTVHLCRIEGNKAFPSADLIARYRELWGVDIYVLAWCERGDSANLPPKLRNAAERLAELWKKELVQRSSENSCKEVNGSATTKRRKAPR